MQRQKQNAGADHGILNFWNQACQKRDDFPTHSITAEVVLPRPDGMEAGVPRRFGKIYDRVQLVDGIIAVGQRHRHCGFEAKFDHNVAWRSCYSRLLSVKTDGRFVFHLARSYRIENRRSKYPDPRPLGRVRAKKPKGELNDPTLLLENTQRTEGFSDAGR